MKLMKHWTREQCCVYGVCLGFAGAILFVTVVISFWSVVR